MLFWMKLAAESFLINLGINIQQNNELNLKKEAEKILSVIKPEEGVLGNVNHLSKYKIKDKAGTFIGARMGRPEKAKPRELKGSPHVLFPVGEEGGRLRSFQAALGKGSVKSDFPLNFCEKCNKETVYPVCGLCGSKTRPMYYCSSCDSKSFSPFCDLHGNLKSYSNQRINIREYYENAIKVAKLGNNLKIVKGIKGTSSQTHIPEHLSKGIIRASFNLHVNKDGTIRYDATELPITHFKSKEIRTSVEKLRELGYEKDIYGKKLEDEDSNFRIIPSRYNPLFLSYPDFKDEKADDVFLNVTRFLDTMLTNLYGLKPFYNIEKGEELIGHLSVCMAPHNCAGVIARIIGFSKVQGLMASPYIHAAVRRDCDGDEVAVMLLLDVLINFSRSFLPAHRGGTQDAPLILNAKINAGEVDDQNFGF